MKTKTREIGVLGKAPEEIYTSFSGLSEKDRTELWMSGSVEQREAMFDAYWSDVRERERARTGIAEAVTSSTVEIEPVPTFLSEQPVQLAQPDFVEYDI